MYEVITDWTTAAGGGQNSVMYCSTDGNIQDYTVALDAMFTSMRIYLASTTTFQVRRTGRILNPETGTLLGDWNSTGTTQKAGQAAGTQGPDASQVLIRWKTGLITAGRRVQGRTFIPGLANNQYSLGNVLPPVADAITAAAQSFASDGTGAMVWNRPKTGLSGAEALITSGACWSELAVLRRRRR